MEAPVRVKICGITTLEDALDAVAAGAAALGFNFHPASPRYVAPDVVAGIVPHLPPSVCTVGVFVNAPRAQVAAVARSTGLQALQFHGNEDPEFCRGWTQKTIKALRVRNAAVQQLAEAYTVDFILADAYVEGRFGGTGQRLCTAYLAGLDRRRLILAGGLTVETVTDAIRAVRPFAVVLL